MKIYRSNQDHISELLPEYLDNQLDDSQKRTVEDHLQNCSVCREELQDLKVLFEAFEDEEPLEPSENLRIEFLKALENEKEKISEEGSKVVSLKNRRNSFYYFSRIAAGLALLACSYLLGKYHQEQKFKTELSSLVEENREIKQTAMMAMLENTSASKRIQGVNFFEEIKNPDADIIEALSNRMFHDENRNVRLTAVEALGKFTSSEEVKKNLISALETEKDPVIQIAIIQILVSIQEKKAVEPMKQLLENEETESFVKDQIKTLLPTII